MRNLLILGLLLALPAAAAEPVAIVYSLAGEASLAAPAPRPLRLFDRLPAGAAVEVGPGSRVALAFVSGRRYELGERSRVTIGKKDLDSRTGPVRVLPPVHPLPRLLPIAKEDRPGPRAGAVRIRSEEVRGLSPDGTVALADAAVLRFQPVEGAARHRLEIEDSRGTVIFRIDTGASEAQVPIGILAPGAAYHWTVTALERPGPAVRGEAGFVTLSRKAAAAREQWRKTVKDKALLDAVDHGLGLAAEKETGAVIESVAPGSPGERAGLQPDDTILSWSCAASLPAFPEASGGAVRFPYDLLPLEREEAPRRAVTLRGRRGGRDMTWTLTAAEWGIEVRPDLSADLAALHLQGARQIEVGDHAAAERSWRSAAESARTAGDGRLAGWFLDRLARELGETGKWAEADIAFGEALAALERSSEPRAAAELLRRWAVTLQRRSSWTTATERLQEALEFDRRSAPKSLAEARTLSSLGVTAARSGDLAAGEELLRKALAIQEELAPGTVEVTGSLNNLGIIARRRGDLTRAEEYLTQGEELLRRLAPESADRALFLQNLGILAQDRGDLERAESFHRQALAIFEKTAPEGNGVGDCLGNLAYVALNRGDLAAADVLLRRSLALLEKTPDVEDVTSTLTALGIVATRRGDLEAAESHYLRSLTIQEKISREGPGVAAVLGNLGDLATLKGDHDTARAHLQRALSIREKLRPDDPSIAVTLESLGRLEMDSGGDLAEAEKLLKRALAIFEKGAPEGLAVAETLRDLGQVVARRGRLSEAIALHRRALDLQRRIAPETTGEAKALHFLGRAERQAGWLREGAGDLCRAIDVLDRQRGRIGGTQEARSSFEATLGDFYQACLEALINLGRPAEAFHVLERSRARSFLALLAERDFRLSGLPPDLAAERRRLNAEYDRIQSQLTRLSAARDGADIDRLTAELRSLRASQEEIVARMRRESPHSAAIDYPEPFDLGEARAALDPGTVLLAYAVGAERTWLFAVPAMETASPDLSVFPIAIDAKTLREEVETFRRLLKRPGSEKTALQARARRLYDLLVRPAEAQVAGAQRILLSADGPLHTLPFAALMRRDRYLVEWKPIHSALSATVYAELARSGPEASRSGEARVAVFGGPVYPRSAPEVSPDPAVHEAVRRGLTLKPLPHSRREASAIAALYPHTQVYLGQDATEERAKSATPESHIVHFACHGLLDHQFPLNSALALTLPQNPGESRENGLLQAWEILEGVRLEADLVTLSACDTALGREMGGEGLLGLTRAFQYAGARSVLASLWGIADNSTADLMKLFYGYLRAGWSKDEALRAAQVELIRSGSFSHPFYWAAFQLTGAWR